MLQLKNIMVIALITSLGVTATAALPQHPKNLKYSGPVKIQDPWLMDSVDVAGKSFSHKSLLKQPFSKPSKFEDVRDTVFILGGEEAQLHYFSFPVYNNRFAEITVKIQGSDNYKLFVDGKESGSSLKVKPGLRDFTIEILTLPNQTDTVTFSLESSANQGELLYTKDTGRPFVLEDVLYAPHIRGARISPSGRYVLLTESTTSPDKNTRNSHTILDVKSQKTVGKIDMGYRWLPGKDLLWKTVPQLDGTVNIITLNPGDFSETVFTEGVPAGDFTISPSGKHLIYNTVTKGTAEDPDIYRVMNPEDRQPGWRNRSGVAIFDMESGVYRPLTFGNKNVSVADVSNDGNKLLLMSMRNSFGKRPTTLFSLFEYDIRENKTDTIVFEDGFISGAQYSPDGSKVIVSGSPEALGGIGNTLPKDKIANMTEGEMFLIDLNSKKITTPTRDFNPSVGNIQWPSASDLIFFSAENKDRVSLYSYDPKSGKITDLNAPEDIVSSFSVSDNGATGYLIGESAANPENLYAFSIVKGHPQFQKVKSALPAQRLNEINLAEVVDWDFINTKGDTINGRFYLPPDFDPDKKYPLIVNYYGGCSPTSRNFATRYPHHLYATNGYVVYVINPSGATGFGQDFASRHVNTAGEGVAQDIIEGTLKFVDEHPFVDKDKIGCIGASYGGFMTQYLQTVTDIFAAAISHAGISDHTSYWGNGYWGYSYSEVSMADSYPWSDPDLYVKQSPLYNADKINTPILFLHGDEDTNVPPGESVQLFTALSLLGKDTALVEVAGQNHHVMDIDKRQKWQDTIFAWFAKYLQDDPTWWDNLYPSTPY